MPHNVAPVAGGHGYIHVDLVGNAANQAAGLAILEGYKDNPTAGQARVTLVSRMQGGAHTGAPGATVILQVETGHPLGSANAHLQVQALEGTIAGDAAHFGLAHHWCCFSDH